VITIFDKFQLDFSGAISFIADDIANDPANRAHYSAIAIAMAESLLERRELKVSGLSTDPFPSASSIGK
jgi:hypothetical protein